MAGQSAKRVFAPDVAAIHVFLAELKRNVNARHKAGHDELCYKGTPSQPRQRRDADIDRGLGFRDHAQRLGIEGAVGQPQAGDLGRHPHAVLVLLGPRSLHRVGVDLDQFYRPSAA